LVLPVGRVLTLNSKKKIHQIENLSATMFKQTQYKLTITSTATTTTTATDVHR
jgi:hypothetical protein